MLDLASQRPGSVTTLTVDPGVLALMVVNRVPGAAYSHSILRRTSVIKGFDDQWPTLGPPKTAPAGLIADPCDTAMVRLLKDVNSAKTEDQIGAIRSSWRRRLANGKCPTGVQSQFASMLDSVSTLSLEATIRAGEEVIVTISREDKSHDVSFTWTWKFDTKPRGTWLTTYGVALVPKRDERYSLRPSSVAGEFAITPSERRRGEFHYLPSLFFTWLPERRALQDWSVGPTAGFGAQTQTFAVYVGLSALYNMNVAVSVGGSFSLATRLSDKYRSGGTVRENLTDDQLHRKTVLPTWYCSVTFRLGKSPFQSSDSGQAGAAKDKGGAH